MLVGVAVSCAVGAGPVERERCSVAEFFFLQPTKPNRCYEENQASENASLEFKVFSP
jgi:hypothetical protein